MKIHLVIAAILLIPAACSAQQKTTGNTGLKEQNSTDSTEYEITIMDSQFDYWYQTHYTRAMDRDNQTYRSYNRIGVMNWNDYFILGKHRNIIDEHLNYDYNIDYGIEVNRKLFWYFKYIQEEYGIRLLY
ncbi:MAG TPA: DUF6146 family protein [Bacteroidales bacterium]|nr:DUF6146 family protein [Bacteroidales bacterium]HPT02806.1 DUF6146 family protein [Bacteroidales bacterium]